MVFLRALSVLLGTIIGVGIFGLPFVALKAGFFVVSVYFLFMALVVVFSHLFYGEVVSETPGLHRLPGYVGKYLGRKWEDAAFLTVAVGLTGALLAYLIIGGEFLAFLLSPYLGGDVILYTLLFFSLGAYFIFRGIKSVSQVELFLFVILLVILALLFFKAFFFIDIDNLRSVNLKFLALPYGVVLFSLWGTSAIPEVKEIVASKKDFKKIIWLGILISVLFYLLFVFIVLGSSGFNTSRDAISGLGTILGGNIIRLGFIFGVITCFTSFLTLGLTLKKTLWYDFGFSKNTAWVITCFLPLILFLLGMRQFIEIIGFTGAIAIGLEGIIIVFLYRAFLKKRRKKMNPLYYSLVLVFILGIIWEIVYFLAKI